ncbi:MAG: hypothetical protein QXN66_06775 [Thermoplasmatales archaeon]
MSPNRLVLRIMEKRNGLDFGQGFETLENEFLNKKEEITTMINKCETEYVDLKLGTKFNRLYELLEKLILAKRLETGVSTLTFFLYSILSGVAGIIMEFMALISTTGFVGHIILSISIAGGVGGVIFALYSLKKERDFIRSLREMILQF